jgi:hypothetical protein
MNLATRHLHRALPRTIPLKISTISNPFTTTHPLAAQIQIKASPFQHHLRQIRSMSASPSQVQLIRKSPAETIKAILQPHSNPLTFPVPPKNYPRVEGQFLYGDVVEESLHTDGHRAWGFVIYRCTYKSDADWAAFLRLLMEDTEKMLWSAAGELDLLENLALTVFDDPARFDGVTAAVVREHFRGWAAAAPEREQGPGKGLCTKLGFSSQRYTYCLQVGEEELESVLKPEPKRLNDSFVRLVAKDWEPGLEEHDDDDDAYDDELYDGEEPVEGCSDWDVGWMKVQFNSVMLEPYAYLRDDLAWEQYYRRPPSIASFK